MLGRRRRPRVADVATDTKWSLAVATRDGQKHILRTNQAVLDARDRRDYPIRLSILVDINAPNGHALPSGEENQLLNQLEDIIEEEVGDRAVLVHVRTGANVRQLVLQARSQDWIAEFDDALHRRWTDHEIHIMAFVDREWSFYDGLPRAKE